MEERRGLEENKAGIGVGVGVGGGEGHPGEGESSQKVTHRSQGKQ